MASRTSGREVTTIVRVGVLAVALMLATPAAAWAQAVLNGTPDPLAFGDQRINVVSSARTVTVNNDTDDPATGISCSTPDGVFDLAALCPTSVAAHTSFTVNLTFTPPSVGLYSATLTISYDDGLPATHNETETVSLTGTGTDGPNLLVNTNWADVNLGGRHIGAGATGPTTVPMSNPTSQSLTVASVTQVGAGCADFTFGGLPAPGVYAGPWSGSFTVSFDPGTTGERSCDLDFDTNDPDGPYILTVTGRGYFTPAWNLFSRLSTFRMWIGSAAAVEGLTCITPTAAPPRLRASWSVPDFWQACAATRR